jgi:hypothetical protein
MAEPTSTSPTTQPPAESKKPRKDIWDKAEILSRPIQATVTALAIAAIGYFGQQTLTSINTHEQNARLFTELLSKREDAESGLRKDMFNAILTGFFDKEKPEEQNLSKRILKLEMLALNFGDSLSLGPLFSELSRDIEKHASANKHDPYWKLTAAPFQKRLRSLARRVASAQVASISQRGVSVPVEIPLQAVDARQALPDPEDWQYNWPDDVGQLQGDTSNINILELENKLYRITMHFRYADKLHKSINAGLTIDSLGDADNPEMANPETSHTEMNFNLDYFNFPLIDNTRLPNNHRFALVLEKFGEQQIKVRGILFPGMYASQRDKPFLNEAIQQLNTQQKGKASSMNN